MTSEQEFRPVRPDRGTFLVAGPRMLDPNFMHAVVLVCDHGPEGSYGVVVNRPAGLTVGELSTPNDLLEGRTDRLWLGGPVSTDTVQVLHRLGTSVPDSLHVVGDVHLGGDPAVIRAALEQRSEGRELVRFVLGYAGWGPAQLDAELREGAWVVTPSSEELVFDRRPESLWRRVLRKLGGDFAALADEPPDPSWN